MNENMTNHLGIGVILRGMHTDFGPFTFEKNYFRDTTDSSKYIRTDHLYGAS